jgi:hypothetical protein
MIIISNVGDVSALKNMIIISFEYHCYEFYAINLGLQSILSIVAVQSRGD